MLTKPGVASGSMEEFDLAKVVIPFNPDRTMSITAT
jgi:hypothetical protein